MKILLSHTASLETLRRYDLRKRLATGERCTITVPEEPPTQEELKRLDSLGLSGPAELLVNDYCHRGSKEPYVLHVMSTPLPKNSVVAIAPGIWCVSPELLAIQMAKDLTLIELIFLLGELFGTYALSEGIEKGMFTRDAPLTDPERVLALLSKLKAPPGAKKLRRAIRYACVGSASPRETRLSMRLGLPPSLGGYGLKVLSMNEPLEVRRINSKLERGVRKPDVQLKAQAGSKAGFDGVALDYDGEDHITEEGHTHDLIRQNELMAINFKDYGIDKNLYHDLDYMDGLVEQVRQDIGLPKQHFSKEEARKRRAQRKELHDELERIDGFDWSSRVREYTYEAVDEYVPDEAYGFWD